MFGGRFSSHIGLLGIDIGSRSIKLLQLQQTAGSDGALGNQAEPTAHSSKPAALDAAKEKNLRCDSLEVIGACEVEQDQWAMGNEADPTANGSKPTADDRDGDDGPDGGERVISPTHPLTLSPFHDSPSHASPAHPLTARLRATFVSGRFTGRRCVVSLPRDDVRVQSVRLPKMPETELRQAVRWEAAQRFDMSHDAMEVDFIRTGATLQSPENREEVIILAASHETIERRLTPIIEAGFRPIAIDTDFAALARVFSRQFRRESDRQTVRAIVEVGTTGSTVLILRGDQICFCKPLEISGQLFNHAVAEHLDMDLQSASELRLTRMIRAGDKRGVRCQVSGVRSPDTSHLTPGTCHDPSTERAVYEAVRPLINDLVREVNMCLRYFGVTFRGKPPSQIILTGGDGLEPRLAEHIERGCKVLVTHDDQHGTLSGLVDDIHSNCGSAAGHGLWAMGLQAELTAHSSKLSSSPGCWAVAAGLSLRGIAVGEGTLLSRLWAMGYGLWAHSSNRTARSKGAA